MKQYGVHQLILSTAAVYKPMYYCLNKTLSLPSTPYGLEQIYCEQAIQRSNISAYILRLFNVGGLPSILFIIGRITIQRHISFHWPLMLILLKILYFMGRTRAFAGCTRDYIHVADVVNAFLRCLDRPLRNNHQILNICSNRVIGLKKLSH